MTTSSPAVGNLGNVRLGAMGLGEGSSWFDAHVVDGAVNAAGWLTRLTAIISSWWDKWIIDGLFVRGVAYSAPAIFLPGSLVRVGPCAVVCAGDDGGISRIRVLLRVSLSSYASTHTLDHPLHAAGRRAPAAVRPQGERERHPLDREHRRARRLPDLGAAVGSGTTRRAGFQFIERAPWIPSIGAEYFLGVDGITFLLILLTTMMGFIAILSSWTAITERVKEYYIFLLVLQTGMLGAFMSLDFLLFFLFWEVMLVPMYFLIGIWGSANRLYSAIKFFLYTLVGSVVMLLGILALYFYNHSVTGVYTFDVTLFQTAPQISPLRPAVVGCSWRSSSASRSRCRCSRSTPGCPTRTPTRRRPAR